MPANWGTAATADLGIIAIKQGDAHGHVGYFHNVIVAKQTVPAMMMCYYFHESTRMKENFLPSCQVFVHHVSLLQVLHATSNLRRHLDDSVISNAVTVVAHHGRGRTASAGAGSGGTANAFFDFAYLSHVMIKVSVERML